MTEDGDVWVDRPGIGLLMLTRTVLGAVVGIYILARFGAGSDWRPVPLALVALGALGLLLAIWLGLASMKQISYSLRDDRLDVMVGEWRQRSVPLRDVVEVQRIRVRVNPFRGYPSYTTRGFNLLEVVDRLGTRVQLSPRDVGAFELELGRRIAAAKETSR